MQWPNLSRLAVRQTLRELRGGSLGLLLAAMWLAVTVSTAIALLGDRLQQGMNSQAAEVLGGDLIIKTSRELPSELLTLADTGKLSRTKVLEFSTVVLAGESMQLVSAKAVSEGYPLRGWLRSAAQPFAEDERTQDIPAPGEVWLEPRLFPLLQVKPGDTLFLGEKELVISRAITYESDRGGDFYSFSPRAMFNMADVPATGVIQPGSRVLWKYLFAGNERSLKSFRAEAEPQLDVTQQIRSTLEDSPSVGNSVNRLKQFLGLASLATVLLAGVAVALAARRFAERHFDTAALLRCSGASQRDVTWLFVIQLLVVAVLAIIPGLLVGWAAHEGVLLMLRDVLPAWLPAPGWEPWMLGTATGLVLLPGFALPPLIQLHRVTPLRVLRREIQPLPPAAWLLYITSLTVLVILLRVYTNGWGMALAMVAGGCVILAAATLLLNLVGKLVTKLLTHTSSVPLRLSAARLTRQRSLSNIQLLGFSLTFMAMAIVLILRMDLLGRWEAQLPDDAPNQFAMNIDPADVAGFDSFLEQNQLPDSQLYPVIRGRLTEINGLIALDVVQDHALERELNLTWSEQLPEQNVLKQGQWWSSEPGSEVSVEFELAERLGLALGDKLTFDVNGQAVTAEVTSFREVQWENFRPNFFMVFPQVALDGLPATWLNSFYVPQEKKTLLNDLLQQFPSVTLLDIDSVMSRVRSLIQQAGAAINYMLLAVLGAGLLVLLAAIETSLDERRREGALLRTMGASSLKLQQVQVMEFVVMGGLSGILGLIGAEICSYLLYQNVFKLNWEPSLWLWWLPFAAALVTGVTGWLGTRSVRRVPPLVTLRRVMG
ncbi:ABC transporter permease [Endozoicomonadaceae bacterium StTr2]